MSVLRYCFFSMFSLHWESSLDSSGIPKFKNTWVTNKTNSSVIHLHWTNCYLLKTRTIWVGLGLHPDGTFHLHLQWICISAAFSVTRATQIPEASHCSPCRCANQRQPSWVVKLLATCNEFVNIFLLLWPNEHSWYFTPPPCFQEWKLFLSDVTAFKLCAL